jgi:hypothetical protein
MPLPTKPAELIVPIVTVNSGTLLVHELWGTAFLVQPGLFMSAKHVFGIEVPPGQTLGAVLLRGRELEPIVFPLTSVHTDPDYDIATAQVAEWPRSDSLNIATDDMLFMNQNVLTIEYSHPERGVQLNDGRAAMGVATSNIKLRLVCRSNCRSNFLAADRARVLRSP